MLMLFRDFQRVQLNLNIYGHKSNCEKTAASWVFCNMLFFAFNLIFKRIQLFSSLSCPRHYFFNEIEKFLDLLCVSTFLLFS